MTKFVGSNLYVSFKGSAITADQTSFDTDRDIKLAEVTAGADAAASYLTTYTDGSAKLTLYSKVAGTATTDPEVLCVPGAAGTLIWAPEGTATGKPKYTVTSAIVEKMSTKHPFEKAVELAIDFKFSAAVSGTVY